MSGIGNLKLFALDSNIFIYNLEANSPYVQFTDKIFKRLISNKAKALVNIITLTEILSYSKTGNVVDQIIEDFMNTPNLTVVDVGREVAIEAARIRREYGFKLPDAIQLATAKLNKAQAFITNDQRLKQFKEVKVIMLDRFGRSI